MAADFGASIVHSIRGCLLILLAVGLLSSSNERFVYMAGTEDKHFKTVSVGSLLGDANGCSSSGHGGEFNVPLPRLRNYLVCSMGKK